MRRFCKDWPKFAHQCLAVVCEAGTKELANLVQTHFGEYARTGLTEAVHGVVEAQIEHSSTQTKAQIDQLLGLETLPFTLNYNYFSSYREKYLAMYKAARAVSFLLTSIAIV